MKISIVTAAHNRAATIADTIGSVRSQTYEDIEHVVQDGGSTDGTVAVLERHAAPRMRVESAPDAGLYDGINKGIARAEQLKVLTRGSMMASQRDRARERRRHRPVAFR